MTTPHPADAHDLIHIQGSRVNNLKSISVDIPKRRFTAVTGVSGSGKSSLVFGTIAAESQRLINETYSAFVQGFMPTQQRPDVDLLSGITSAIVVDQERIGSDPRSTVGTATDAGALLRILFSRLASPSLGGPKAYSFNVESASGVGVLKKSDGSREKKEFTVIGGMCTTCEGRGTVSEFNLDAIVDKQLSLNDGAILVPGYSMDGWYGRIFSGSGFFDMDKAVGEYSKQELDDLLYREATKIKAEGINVTYEGLIPKMKKSMLSKDVESLQPHVRRFVESAIVFRTCPACHGTRLNDAVRASVITGADGGSLSIADCNAMPLTDLATWVRGLAAVEDQRTTGVRPILDGLVGLLDSFVTIGLGYLSLDRSIGTLSGGESQRVKMVRHLGSALTDITYIFDEPSIGLHPHDIQNLNSLLLQLRDKGNTVLVVEHKPEVISVADHVIDMGPAAGALGGEVVFEGSVADLRDSGTVTGISFSEHVALKTQSRVGRKQTSECFSIRDASTNNLRGIDVDIPAAALTVLTGVAGSGKSSLVSEIVAAYPQANYIDQSAIKGSRRSNPATYTGLLDPIRKAFAKANGVKPALFSPNSEGACPTCKGMGVIYTELGFMATISTTCEDCGGKRFQAEVLEYTLGSAKDGDTSGSGVEDAGVQGAGVEDVGVQGAGAYNIADVLEMSVDKAREFFSAEASKVPAAVKILDRLHDVGLGYLTLGQQLPTLSGGERQRLKLATKMGEKQGSNLYILDEPTTGLHLQDVRTLLALIDRLVGRGATVIVVEHHQAVMAHADWIIDLGPGAGLHGGELVFAGTPDELVSAWESVSSVTGQYLAQYVS